MLAALIFAPDREMASWANEAAGTLQDLCVYKTLHSHPAQKELDQLVNIFSPEVVLLELEPAEPALAAIREIRSGYPKTAILGLLRHKSPEIEGQALEAGASEVLILH